MNRKLRIALAVAGLAVASSASGQVTLFGQEEFRGRSFMADRPIGNLERWGFNDRASSAIVERGRWLACEHERFDGRCVVLQPGQYPTLRQMGLNDRVSSIRPADDRIAYDDGRWRRRDDERLFEVPVTGVRAVVGPPEQRCWVERQQIVEGGRSDPNVPGAVVGGVIGGILGHQIGSGRGQDVATVGGAIAGSVVGGNVNRGDAVVSTQDVQRCETLPRTSAVDYYDVTYSFNGVQHNVQTTSPPGRTILVNRQGEPRLP
jgi:uncharacterized protein YcfJ